MTTTLHALGLDFKQRDLPALRRWFAAQPKESHVTRVMELAGVSTVCMTNSPFDEAEQAAWQRPEAVDHRFRPALRLDA